MTEFSVGDRKLYLSPVMDLFDRQIISHSIGTSPNLSLTNDSLREALSCLQPGQQPLVHSDPGRPVPARLVAESAAGRRRRPIDVTQGQRYDNAVMENFFGHLKEELFHRVRFISTDALEAALNDYIRWYNTERISTKLEGLSPMLYRAQALAA